MPTAGRRHAWRWVLVVVALMAPALLYLFPSPVAGEAPSHPAVQPQGCTVPAPATASGYAARLDRLGQAGDATLTVRLRSGHVAWIFADTLMPGHGFLHSTVVMQHAGCFTPSRTQLLPDDRDGTYWWPTAAAALPDGTVLVTAIAGYTARLRAALCREVGGRLVFAAWLRSWPQPRDAHDTFFGTGLLVEGGRLLVYGTRQTGRDLVFGRELYLASVPLRGLATGTGWHRAATPIYGALPHGTDTTVSAYRDARGYHLLTLQDGVYGNGPLVSLDGPTPAGPFTAHPLLTYDRPGQVHYNAAAHPEIRLAGGSLLVTINNNWPLDDRTLHPLATYAPSLFAVRR